MKVNNRVRMVFSEISVSGLDFEYFSWIIIQTITSNYTVYLLVTWNIYKLTKNIMNRNLYEINTRSSIKKGH